MCVSAFVCLWVCLCVSVCLCVFLCVSVCVFVCVFVGGVCVCEGLSVCVCTCVCLLVFLCRCGSITWGDPWRGDLPAHGYLPEAGSGHRYPLDFPLVVGVVHPTKHHHAAVSWLAEESRMRGLIGGETPQTLSEGCASPSIRGSIIVPILQMQKLRLRGIEYLTKVSQHLMSIREEV